MDIAKSSPRLDQAGFRRTPFLHGPFGPLFAYPRLIMLLVWTDVRAMYVRSVLGLFWVILLPVFYVAVFVFIRIYLFDRSARSADWHGSVLGIGDIPMMALMIFAGFIVFWEASEIISRSPSGTRRYSAYVRDSVFPVEILPWVTIGNAVFNLLIRSALFIIAFWLIVGHFHITALFFPVVIAPMILMMVGVAYAFSAIGTYFRDLDFIVTALMTGMMLLSAVLYPLSEVPAAYRPYAALNPMAMAIEQTREVVLLGRMPDWGYLGFATLAGIVLAWGGFAIYRTLRGGFADVV
jgi:lipopolysaccharide transport system permease protein